MPDSFSLLLKPASGDCNLRCGYCFYLPKRELFPTPRRMSPETLEAVVRRFFACPMPVHAFAWQGGEPTLMGLDFYRSAVRFQRLLAPPGARVTNAFQTNGVLLDDEWAAFLRENRFLVGVSLDGPERLHNRHRRAQGGGVPRLLLRQLACRILHEPRRNARLRPELRQDHLAGPYVQRQHSIRLKHYLPVS